MSKNLKKKQLKHDSESFQTNIPGVGLEYIFNKLPGYIYWKDKDSVYQGCNTNLAYASGVDAPSEIINKTDSDFSWGVEQAAKFREDDLKVMNERCKVITEHILVISGGKSVTISTEKSPLVNIDNEVVGILGVALDVTEAKEKDQSIFEFQKREKRLEAMSTLGGMIAHEIRTPLLDIKSIFRGVNKYLPELISAYKKSIEKNGKIIRKDKLTLLEKNIKKGEDVVNRINLIIDDVTNGLMLTNSEYIATGRNVNLNKLVLNVVNKCLSIPDSLNKVDFDICHEDVISIVKEEALENVISNLCRNALYSIKKARKGRILVSTSIGENVFQVAILDQGTGIPEDQLEHIFSPFFTTKEKGTSAGLGLYFSKTILEKMGGDIKCRSKFGEYTEMVVCLPIDKEL